jgi:hypothetical protein
MSTWCKPIQSHWNNTNSKLTPKTRTQICRSTRKDPMTEGQENIPLFICWAVPVAADDHRSNVNKQTWTLIVLSDTPFLGLVLRICIQITSFQISSTLPHYLQHLSSPTNTWGLLHEIAMSKHLPPSEDRTWRPNLFLDKGNPYCPKNWHDPGWASLITWCLSVCLSLSKSLTRFRRNQI